MAPRRTATATANTPVETVEPEKKITRKRHSLDEFTAMVAGATAVNKPVNDRTVPDDHPLVEAVKRSMDNQTWIHLTLADSAQADSLMNFLRRIARENFGKGMRIKAEGDGITFVVTELSKRGRKPKSAE